MVEFFFFSVWDVYLLARQREGDRLTERLREKEMEKEREAKTEREARRHTGRWCERD